VLQSAAVKTKTLTEVSSVAAPLSHPAEVNWGRQQKSAQKKNVITKLEHHFRIGLKN
jgi:hypothetical protein